MNYPNVANSAQDMYRHHRLIFTIVGFCSMLLLLTVLRTNFASAAACTAPTTDYGTVSNLTTASLPAGTYKIWTRMVAADTTNNTYLLQVDTTCFTVGGSTVQTYTTAQDTANTRFSTVTSNTSDWIAAPTTITFTAAGTHALTLIGNAPGVVVDRVILTQDQTTPPQGTGDNLATPPDITPPVNPTPTVTVSGTTATVTASPTDDSGIVSKVELYVDGASTATQTDTSSPFSFSVTGLSIGTHTFKTIAYDSSGNSQPSSVASATVADTVAPGKPIFTSPTSGASESGTFVATVTATDNVAVTKVEFYLDGGATPQTTDTTGPSPFTGSIDVSTLTGTHTITAKAYDAAGNMTSSDPLSITVTAPAGGDTTGPTITLQAPPAGAVLSDNLTSTNFTSSAYVLTANASDASGVKSVSFQVDGTAVGTADTSAPYTATLDLTKLSCGLHTVLVTAIDNASTPNTSTLSRTFNNTYGADITATPDCHVTYLDLSFLASKYGQTGTKGFTRADINQDGVVNYLDLSALASQYGK